MKMTSQELEWFLALCKKIRESQNVAGDYINHRIHITNVVNSNNDTKLLKIHYAIAHSLKRKKFIRIDRRNVVSFDKRGIEYIEYLKNKKSHTGGFI